MALSLSVLRRFDSIAFTGSRGASESLFEARQKPHGPCEIHDGIRASGSIRCSYTADMVEETIQAGRTKTQ
jgi:hypothetical protein